VVTRKQEEMTKRSARTGCSRGFWGTSNGAANSINQSICSPPDAQRYSQKGARRENYLSEWDLSNLALVSTGAPPFIATPNIKGSPFVRVASNRRPRKIGALQMMTPVVNTARLNGFCRGCFDFESGAFRRRAPLIFF